MKDSSPSTPHLRCGPGSPSSQHHHAQTTPRYPMPDADPKARSQEIQNKPVFIFHRAVLQHPEASGAHPRLASAGDGRSREAPRPHTRRGKGHEPPRLPSRAAPTSRHRPSPRTGARSPQASPHSRGGRRGRGAAALPPAPRGVVGGPRSARPSRRSGCREAPPLQPPARPPLTGVAGGRPP